MDTFLRFLRVGFVGGCGGGVESIGDETEGSHAELLGSELMSILSPFLVEEERKFR